MVQSSTSRFPFLAILRKNSLCLLSSLVVVSAWFAVILISRKPGSMALVQFLLCAGIMMLVAGLVLWRYHRNGQSISFRWIFVTALLLRMISLLGDPLFEDDYYRYLWDGYQTATKYDPYTLAPEAFFDQQVPEIFEPILSLINYPEIATVYGPVSQWLFAVGYLIAPSEVWPLQMLAGMADLMLIWILYRMGAGNALLLYAWSPLLLKEFSLTAHPDIFAILGVMISVYMVQKERALLAGCALALAFGAKVFAILVLPFLLTSGWSTRHRVRMGLAFTMTIAVITVSFGDLTIWMPEGLQAMADSWLFNAPVYLLLLTVFQFQTIKLLLLSAFALFLLIVILNRLRRDPTSASSGLGAGVGATGWQHSQAAFRGDWLFALFLLSVPVINPWYVAWLAPFAVLYPRWWSWTASYAVLLSYWFGTNVAAFGTESQDLSIFIVVLEYVAIALVPLIAIGFKTYRRKRP